MKFLFWFDFACLSRCISIGSMCLGSFRRLFLVFLLTAAASGIGVGLIGLGLYRGCCGICGGLGLILSLLFRLRKHLFDGSAIFPDRIAHGAQDRQLFEIN